MTGADLFYRGDKISARLTASTTQTAVFFGGKRVAVNGAAFVPDRLGSNAAGKFFPYGEDRGTPIANDQVKYATYTRDSATGLDYAEQRYYSNQFGRFMTADQYVASSGAKAPQSWNRYTYVLGDPINFKDPTGRFECGDDEDFEACDDDGGGGGGGGFCGVGFHFDPAAGDCEPDGGEPQPQPPQPSAPTCSDWTCMPAAFSRAVQALTLDPDCLNLFGSANSRANGWNPVNVLTDIVYGSNSHGSVSFSNLGSSGGAAVTSPSGRFGISGLITNKVTITINEYTDPTGALAYWNAGYAGVNAELLLHELAHAYTLLRGSGGFNGTRFISDAKLDSLIQADCFPGGLN